MGTVNAGGRPAGRRGAAACSAADGWAGAGIRSPEHWVTWKAGVSRARAEGLVHDRPPRRRAPRVLGPVRERAAWARTPWSASPAGSRPPATPRSPPSAPQLLVSQLDRLLRSLPEQPDGSTPPGPSPSGRCACTNGRDGWLRGPVLPPRRRRRPRPPRAHRRPRRENHDRQGLDADASLDDVGEYAATQHGDSQPDTLVRMASEASQHADQEGLRTGRRGERNKIVLHHDVDPDGNLGPGQTHPRAGRARCDRPLPGLRRRGGDGGGAGSARASASTRRSARSAGRSGGPWQDATRAAPTRCAPSAGSSTSTTSRHWEDGGETVPGQPPLPVPRARPGGAPPGRVHHRRRSRTDRGPEVLDRWGQPIAPPDPSARRPGAPTPTAATTATPYTPPLAERLHRRHLHLELSGPDCGATSRNIDAGGTYHHDDAQPAQARQELPD